nr:uncharacterized protein LOC107438390 [Parasteatoda tepidariorum]
MSNCNCTAPLPADRLRTASVFEITGIDFHQKLTISLSTESFLQAVRRHVARGGRPAIVYSDNATNLVGANSLLKKINWDFVVKNSSVNKINWKFILPVWWGGIWERLIGIRKRILRKVLGRTSLNFEELYTVLCDCESIINKRSLTYLSEDISDLVPFTPSMLL